MQLSEIVNVFIGLALTFGTISLVVSAIVEAIASILRWRSRTLLSGLQQLLNDPSLTGLALDVLNHACVNPLSSGNATAAPGRVPTTLLGKFAFFAHPAPGPASVGAAAAVSGPETLPSYIPPSQFAAALVDIVAKQRNSGGSQGDPRSLIMKSVPDQQLQTMLLGMYDRADQNLGAFQKQIADWFDASMDRLSGFYKRRTQLWSFAIAVGLAALLDVDAIALARHLWATPTIVSGASTIKTMPDYKSAFELWSATFPFGWALPPAAAGVWAGPVTLLGWLLTAFATLFGAPFWFDTLQRFVQIRGTGTAPDEKRASGT